VPVDQFNLKDGRRDLALVSLAGPLTNVLIALAGAGVLHLFSYSPAFGAFSLPYTLVYMVVHLNLLLAIFNLLPIPPLDGSKIFSLFLPEKEAAYYLSLSNVGFFIIFFLFLFPIGGFSLGQFIFYLVSYAERLLGI
jgi:Zn-dependent protease